MDRTLLTLPAELIAVVLDGARHFLEAILKMNDEVTFSGRHLGFTWSMTSKITSYLRPTLFVDEQVRGPFTMFTHEHRFESTEQGRH
ncbi:MULTISPECIES: hypothetical protein [unclassified Rhodococcus (in: high G+C Gram-positive bacteria)]|uniref:hypothetical protein n=1 Tax=unclassified Rhodococcus (in: high G+C Gram-positive bacteria) TaxID=192944 RepID=UPI001AEB2191|nr:MULTISPECIES: hypothetical protein [unclassified Rhodococcus (in: high G+C Gram-positive bacteria)]MBP2520905.1 ligand-binding SRPBCC domain-containing protein [Rhodococcus sp. PvP104]